VDIVNIFLLALLLIAAVWTVMRTRLIRAVIGLAVVSVLVAVLVFQMGSPIAAVFELSVCAGLISVIFFTTISFTRRLSYEQAVERRKERLGRFGYLPFVLLILGLLMLKYPLPQPMIMLHDTPVIGESLRVVFWDIRQIDLLGQVAILLAGAIGVIVLFKEIRK